MEVIWQWKKSVSFIAPFFASKYVCSKRNAWLQRSVFCHRISWNLSFTIELPLYCVYVFCFLSKKRKPPSLNWNMKEPEDPSSVCQHWDTPSSSQLAFVTLVLGYTNEGPWADILLMWATKNSQNNEDGGLIFQSKSTRTDGSRDLCSCCLVDTWNTTRFVIMIFAGCSYYNTNPIVPWEACLEHFRIMLVWLKTSTSFSWSIEKGSFLKDITECHPLQMGKLVVRRGCS